jgi:HAD superfamily hydrolase (TIGR01549 family)
MRALLFDFDGTLVDSPKVYFRLVEEACPHLSLSVPPFEFLTRVMNEGFPLTHYYAFTEESEDAVRQLPQLIRQFWGERFHKETVPFPQALQVIPKLAERYLLAIVTSSPARSLETLRLHQLLDCFTTIITAEQVDFLKPHPQPVEKALDRLGVYPHEAFMIGDTPLDMLAAIGAGVPPIGIATGTASAELLREKGARAVFANLMDFSIWLQAKQDLPFSP